MAVAIDTSRLALDVIPRMQRELDQFVGDGKRFQIHRVSIYATILSHDSETGRQLYSLRNVSDALEVKREALNWQADPDDDQGDAAVLHHLHQQAMTVPLLSSVMSQRDRGHSATTLTGTALSPSTNARTEGRLLSSFHRHSFRISSLKLGAQINSLVGVSGDSRVSDRRTIFPTFEIASSFLDCKRNASRLIVWAGPQRDEHLMFLQMQVDVVDLLSRRLPTSAPRKRRRTALNQFLQLSHSPVIDDTSRRNPLPQTKRFNGVRHRTDRNIWVAEWKPPKHKTKQDFGNFKSEDEAARAVDAAFHHYGRPDLLNFPHTSLQFRHTAPAGLDQKAKVKFVREEAKLVLAATAASSPLHSPHTSDSLQIRELSTSPRRCPSGPFRSLSEISSPFRCSGPDEVDAVVSQPRPQMLHDSTCDISTPGVLTDWGILKSVQNGEQGWDWAEDPCTLAAPLNSSASESPSLWLDSILRSSPSPTYPRSPSPSPFQEEIALGLLEHQSI